MNADEARMLDRLERLVAFDTQNPPGYEVEAARYLAHQLTTMGLDTSLSEFKAGRANVVARLNNGPGPTFAFNSHIDVVPAGSGWRCWVRWPTPACRMLAKTRFCEPAVCSD